MKIESDSGQQVRLTLVCELLRAGTPVPQIGAAVEQLLEVIDPPDEDAELYTSEELALKAAPASRSAETPRS